MAEPTFQSYNSERLYEKGFYYWNKRIEYKSIELPIGLRHYFFLNDKLKIFANAFYLIDFPLNSNIITIRQDGSTTPFLDINSETTYAYGLGINYNNRFSLEVRHQLGRNLLNRYFYYSSSYSSFSLIVGYRIF